LRPPFPKITFAVIHNHDGQRLAHVLPNCRRLAESVGGSISEVCDQPQIDPHSRVVAIARGISCWALQRQWDRHLQVERAPLMKSFLTNIYGFWWSYYGVRWRGVCGASDAISFLCRRSAIERILARKHVTAWATCNQTSDYIVVVEDDAVFLPDTHLRFVGLLDQLSTRNPANDLYVDLAGGLPIDALRVTKLVSKRENALIHFHRPVTNTACVYMISAATARRFCRILCQKPWFRWVPADWLINGLLMRAIKEGAVFDCMHADPPIWVHGTAEGTYASTLEPWDMTHLQSSRRSEA